MSTPNGRTCEECGDPLTGLQIYLCDKRIKPECSYNRLLKQRAAHKRAVYKRKKKAKAKLEGPAETGRIVLGTVDSKTCAECSTPLIGRQRVICTDPECFRKRMNRRAKTYWKIKRDREKLAGSRGPYKDLTYCIKQIQSATPEKLIKIVHTMVKEA